jgi:hypothetical protein
VRPTGRKSFDHGGIHHEIAASLQNQCR